MRIALVCATLLATACGTEYTPGGNGGTPDGGGPGPGVDAAVVTPDAPPPPAGYTRLIEGSWTLPGGSGDVYRCVRLTVPADTYVTNIQAVAPLGTHHTVLSISDGGTAGPDGEYACDVNELGMVMLYASGVGTSPLDFPAGVGVKIAAGTQIHLNLHLFNASDTPRSGTSGLDVKAQPTPPAQLAEMVFAGTYGIYLPSNNTTTNVTGGCTENTSYSLFAVWPHMHQLGTHMKVTHKRGTTTTVLHDGVFDFGEQYYYLKDPVVQVQSGDVIRVTCSFLNNTGRTVTFGESSESEMCFSGMYRYPAAGSGLFDCVSNLPLTP